LKNAYEIADSVQNASNLSGVLYSLPRLLDAIRAEQGGGPLAKHPALVVYIDKVLDLMGYGFDLDRLATFGSAWDQVIARTRKSA